MTDLERENEAQRARVGDLEAAAKDIAIGLSEALDAALARAEAAETALEGARRAGTIREDRLARQGAEALASIAALEEGLREAADLLDAAADSCGEPYRSGAERVCALLEEKP